MGIHRRIPAERVSNAENVSIWWRHHVLSYFLNYFTSHVIKGIKNGGDQRHLGLCLGYVSDQGTTLRALIPTIHDILPTQATILNPFSNHYCFTFCEDTQIARFMGANMGPTWVLSAPCGPHVGPINHALRVKIHIPEYSDYPTNAVETSMKNTRLVERINGWSLIIDQILTHLSAAHCCDEIISTETHCVDSLTPVRYEWTSSSVIIEPVLVIDDDASTGSYWWLINVGSCNCLVPSGNKPLPELMLI